MRASYTVPISLNYKIVVIIPRILVCLFLPFKLFLDVLSDRTLGVYIQVYTNRDLFSHSYIVKGVNIQTENPHFR